MAVTRINNNQITDASQGNVNLGINANTKIQNFSITAQKIANNLTYGSDLTVTGNLTVNGSSTAIDTTITTIEDPVIVLASTQTGAPAVDIGFLGERGTANNIAFVWNEANSEFVTAFTSTSETNTTISILAYADLHTNNMVVGGTTSLIGNVLGAANFSGNVTAGNLLTPGLISATANVTGGNVLTGGIVSATGNISGANVNATGNIVPTANVTYNLGSATAQWKDLYVGGTTIYLGNIQLKSETANTLSVTATDGSALGAVSSATVSATGTVTGGNVLTGGLISATATITGGNLATGGTASVGGNITGANLLTGGLISATSTITSAANITGGNILPSGLISATANVTGGNVLTGGIVSATSNVTGGNLISATVTNPTAMTISTNAGNINLEPFGNVVVNNKYINGLQLTPVQDADAASKYYVDTIATTGITIHEAVFAATISNLAIATGGTITYAQPNGAANGIGATLTTTGTYTTIDTANVQTVGTRILVKDQGNAVQNGVYVYSNATVITRSLDTDQYGSASTEAFSINDYFFTTNGNVNAGTAFVVNAPPGEITFGTSNIGFGIFSQSQVYSANTSAGLILNGTVFSAQVDNNTTAFDGLGNIIVKTGANLTTPNIGAATGTSLSVTGTVTAASTVGGVITGSSASVTGNVSAANFIGNISGNISSPGANTNIIFNDDGIANAVSGFTFNKTSNTVTVGANVDAVSFNGNVFGTSVSASGTVTAASTVGGVITGTSSSVTGTQTAASTVGGVITGSSSSVTGTQTAASTVGGVITGSSVSVTGNVSGANLSISGGNIDSAAAAITVNGASGDVNFAVNGDTTTIFFADAGTETASFGNTTQTTNALVAFNSTTSIKLPVGNTVQRPATGVTGMQRFNTTTNALEIYNNTAWQSVGATEFTVIADEQFNGDGTTVAFTLSSTQTTNSCIVSINGVVQIPTIAYSVSGTDPTCVLTFTEAPAVGDIIDVRQITTTTTVLSISNSIGNAVVAVQDTSATVAITGDLTVSGNATILGNVGTNLILNGTSRIEIPDANGNIHFDINSANDVLNIGQFNCVFNSNVSPAANVTYDLGTATKRWKDLYLANSTIYLGNSTISANATAIVLTNPAGGQTVMAGATASSSVAGNITGGNVLTGGVVSATGNITGSYILGNGSQLTGIDATSIQNGTSSVSVIASGGNVRANIAGATITTTYASGLAVTGLVSVTGTVTGASVVGGVITGSSTSVTGTVTGASVVGGVITGSSTSVTGNITGGNITTAGILTVNSGAAATAIVNGAGNAVGNIGSTGARFNTVFALATSAQYADLAENYAGDAAYAPGTVVDFGGDQEVTISTADMSSAVAGVVSTNPSYLMNAGQAGDNVVAVALTGRVPTKVVGSVAKGDLMVSAGNGQARAEANPRVGSVIGKALEDSEGDAVIEVVVGRF